MFWTEGFVPFGEQCSPTGFWVSLQQLPPDEVKMGQIKTTYPYTTGSLEGQTGETVTYSYGDSEWKDLLTAYNGQAITYDEIGNPLRYKNGFTFTWQNGRRLATAAANGKALSFAYNESGIRTQKTVDGVTTEYYLDGSTVLAQKTGNNTVWYYYDCNGTREALEYGGQVYYYLYNAQGDVMALYDNDLNIVAEYTYDSWGKLLSVTGSLAETVGKANPFRYRGYYYDSETELYYLNSRYYDPETGRFINLDNQLSSNDPTGLNTFAYCGNNPINRADPTGEAWWHWALGAAIVAACAAATVITAGGFAAGMAAVAAVSSGVAASSVASTVAAGAFISSAMTFGASVAHAASTSKSLKQFNKKGNWGVVRSTAVSAVVGGAGAYFGTKRLGSVSSKTNSKVISKRKNDIIDLLRTGSALKEDSYHAFPNIVDNYAGYATKSPINNGTLYQIEGSLNGTVGRFEWIVQDQQVTHRMFVPGGGINGIPILP